MMSVSIVSILENNMDTIIKDSDAPTPLVFHAMSNIKETAYENQIGRITRERTIETV